MRLPVLLLSLLLVQPALAQNKLQQEWRIPSPPTTMRALVDRGFEIKGVYEHDTELGSGHLETVTTLLQRGAEVYRCREISAYDTEATLETQALQCTVLTAPYDTGATAAG